MSDSRSSGRPAICEEEDSERETNKNNAYGLLSRRCPKLGTEETTTLAWATCAHNQESEGEGK